MNSPIVISIFSVGIALFSLLIAFFTHRRSELVSRAQLFISMRNRFLEVRSKLPAELDDPQWDAQPGSEQWRVIESYWYNSFDEWFVTTKIFPRDRERLWKVFYSHAIQSSLKHKSMRKVLRSMVDGSVSFGGFRDEFRSDVEKLLRALDPKAQSI